jgi:hypothetical protein
LNRIYLRIVNRSLISIFTVKQNNVTFYYSNMIISALATKLRIKPGKTLLILNAPPIYFEMLGALPQNKIDTDIVSDSYAFIHLFVMDSSNLQKWAAKVLRLPGEDTIFWISYPKKAAATKSDLSRDSGWEIMFKAGYRPVTQVAIDTEWSALRFRKGTFNRSQPPGDNANRVVEIPEDFRQALALHADALEIFRKFAYTYHKEYVRWIEDAKKPETRERRISKAVIMISEGKKFS